MAEVSNAWVASGEVNVARLSAYVSMTESVSSHSTITSLDGVSEKSSSFKFGLDATYVIPASHVKVAAAVKAASAWVLTAVTLVANFAAVFVSIVLHPARKIEAPMQSKNAAVFIGSLRVMLEIGCEI
ncbi:MAG TPA: hypothetical protein VG347_13320 [Verrucomicrobiae bacterium]|nr:hypothetical protein [Verrucomicrobiae bacterium]